MSTRVKRSLGLNEKRHKFRGRNIINSKIPKICLFLYKQKSKNMCSFQIDQLLVSICFVFDCVTNEDKYSCPEPCICLSLYATWND